MKGERPPDHLRSTASTRDGGKKSGYIRKAKLNFLKAQQREEVPNLRKKWKKKLFGTRPFKGRGRTRQRTLRNTSWFGRGAEKCEQKRGRLITNGGGKKQFHRVSQSRTNKKRPSH